MNDTFPLWRVRWHNARTNLTQTKFFLSEKKYHKFMGKLNSMSIVYKVLSHGKHEVRLPEATQ